MRIGATAVSLRPVSLVWPVCSSRSHRNSQLCVLLVAAWPHVSGKLTTLDVKATDRNTQKKDTEKRRDAAFVSVRVRNKREREACCISIFTTESTQTRKHRFHPSQMLVIE